MKNLFVPRICFLLLLSFLLHNARAQQASTAYTMPPAHQTEDGDTAAFDRSAFGGIPLNELNIKMVRDLTSMKDARNIHWFRITGGYIVYFTDQQVRTRRYYDSNGEWLHDICFYKEEHLPKEIKRQLKNAFANFEIVNINEIINEHGSLYLVQLQDDKCWKSVLLDQDDVKVADTIIK